MDPYQIVKNPLSTEKSIRLMESQNKLIFVVDRKAKKHEIKEAIEHLFQVKVQHVNTVITPHGQKRAYVTFHKDTPALDVATNLGMI